jgi:hypothetical protein
MEGRHRRSTKLTFFIGEGRATLIITAFKAIAKNLTHKINKNSFFYKRLAELRW